MLQDFLFVKEEIKRKKIVTMVVVPTVLGRISAVIPGHVIYVPYL